VVIGAVNDIWSMDIVDMNDLKEYNNGIRYFLTCIDLASRFAWARILKSKTGKETLEAIKSIIASAKATPRKIWVDRGSEFYNRDVQSYLNSKGTTLYSTYGEMKAVMIERFNRTLKSMMWLYFTEHQTRKWTDILQDLVDQYNNKVHSSIGMTPAQAYEEKLTTIKTIEPVETKPKFKEGDRVRISRIKGLFEKGYTPNWSYEIFTVARVIPGDPVTYELKDASGELVKGKFYEPELQKTEQEDVYLVEKVIKERGKGKNKEYLVKWLGYDDKFNSWVKASDFVQ
jgi:hypothetical protein